MTWCTSASEQACGLVKESRLIDERSEWRTFSDKVNLEGLLCHKRKRRPFLPSVHTHSGPPPHVLAARAMSSCIGCKLYWASLTGRVYAHVM